ncbi:unnamed protein product [Ilex paraguariensis]|uniref:O-fucosyltransferase family protein n=1 Tax=Ilex paraguariensis TaxID=185542 RepID=A0ABC8QNF1_9AQUA
MYGNKCFSEVGYSSSSIPFCMLFLLSFVRFSYIYIDVACLAFQICYMVIVARLLNLTLVVPDLDKRSFWADPSNFEDIFDVRHFIDSLSDEVVKRLPKRFTSRYG